MKINQQLYRADRVVGLPLFFFGVGFNFVSAVEKCGANVGLGKVHMARSA